MSDSKETHKASFTVQASVSYQAANRMLGEGCWGSVLLNSVFGNSAVLTSDIRPLASDPFVVLSKFYGQATKGTRWMPWHFEAMKDVASCDKLR